MQRLRAKDAELPIGMSLKTLPSVLHSGMRFFLARPEILKLVGRPFITTNWTVWARMARLFDHIATAHTTLGQLALPSDSVVDIVQFDLNGIEYRLTLDQARWLAFEGPLV